MLDGLIISIDAMGGRARERSEVFHTDKTVSMEAKPSQALRKGKGSSMWNAIASSKQRKARRSLSAPSSLRL